MNAKIAEPPQHLSVSRSHVQESRSTHEDDDVGEEESILDALRESLDHRALLRSGSSGGGVGRRLAADVALGNLASGHRDRGSRRRLLQTLAAPLALLTG